MRRLSALVAGMLATLAAHGAPLPPAGEVLVRSANVWEAHERGDLARLALEKLTAARPDLAGPYVLLGELCLRMGDSGCAREVLARLQREHPNEAATRQFATAYRLATTDRLAWASVRRLVETGRGAEARTALDALLPDGAPGGYASLEYYHLLAATPGGFARARAGLTALAAERADDPRYRAALGELLSGNPATRGEGRRLSAALRGREDLRPDDRSPPAAAAHAPAHGAGPHALAGLAPAAQAALRAALIASLRERLDADPADAQVRSALATELAAGGDNDGARDLYAGRRAEISTAPVAAAFWAGAAAAATPEDAPALTLARSDAARAFAAGRFEDVIEVAARVDAAGEPGEALDLLTVAARLDPQSHWLFATRVRFLTAHDDPDAALALLTAPGRPAADPDDAALEAGALDARASRALAAGDGSAARTDLERAHALAPRDPWIALSLARRDRAAGDTALARTRLAVPPGLEADPDWRFAQGLLDESLDDRAGARAALAAVPDAQWSAGMRALEDRLVAAARPAPAHPADGFVTAGLADTLKPGAAGLSQLDTWQLPVEWRVGRTNGDYYFLRTDAVRMDAGALAPGSTIPLLGTIQAAGAAGAAAAGRFDGNRSGLALGVGYTTSQVAADLGTTPLGFWVTHVIGGIRYTPTLGPVDVSIGFARRPVTSSLLSYGGLRDPVTGREWGGVVETGPRLQAGIYRDEGSVQLAVRATRLTGENVLDNSFTGARFAADRRIARTAVGDLYLGLTANYWSYAASLLNYTYGSGGYYSPQSYLSVGVPLALEGAHGRWSYRARAALARSTSSTRDMPFYPNDPALQAAGALAPLPSGYSAPVYTGGRSTGTTVSFYSALEYAASPRLVVGAVLDLDRTDYYHPTELLVYVRVPFGGSPAVTLAKPPRPVRPYADY